MPEELSSIKIDLDLISSFPPQFCATTSVHYRYVSLLLYSTRMRKRYEKSSKKLPRYSVTKIWAFKNRLFSYISAFNQSYLNVCHEHILICHKLVVCWKEEVGKKSKIVVFQVENVKGDG